MFQISVLTVLILLFSGGCNRIPDYPETPRIEFQSLNKYRGYNDDLAAETDSIVVTVYFEDGDGDLGTNSTDTSIQNYFIDTYRIKGNTFEKLDDLPIGKRFPLLAPNEDYMGPLEGTLSVNTEKVIGFDINNPFDPDGLKTGDKIFFTVTIEDRAGHRSNTIHTSVLTITP